MGYSPGFLIKIGNFGLQILSKTTRTNPYEVRNPFATLFAMLLESLGRFPALTKIRHVQNHGLQPRLFGQNRPISAHSKFSRTLHEESRTQLEIYLQASWRRFQGVWADFQHLPKSAMFKTMGYSPGFLVKIGNFGSLQILSKTARTNPYEVRNPFATLFGTLLESLGRFPALTKIRHVQNHGLQPKLFGPNRPISSHLKFFRKPHEQTRMQLEIHLEAYLRRFQGVWVDFPQLPKSAMFKTMGYSPGFFVKIGRFRLIANSPENFTNNLARSQKSIGKHICDVFKEFGPISTLAKISHVQNHGPGFLVKIGRFRLIANSPENFTNKSLRTQKSICKHVGDVFGEFGPISSTYQNPPCAKPWAFAQAFWSKSADFGCSEILPKTSSTNPYSVRKPFASTSWKYV